MADGKGYRIPDPVGPYPTKTFCVTIPDNSDYIAAFMGQMLALTDTWTWEQDGTTRAAQAAELWLPLFLLNNDSANSGEGCSDVPTQLRQDPQTACILQASYDGGFTWNDVYDFRKCGAFYGNNITINFETINTSQTILNDNRVIYNGDILNIAPQWGNGYTTVALRDRAICYTLNAFVQVLSAEILEIKERELEEQKDIIDNFADIFDSVSLTISALVTAGLAPLWAPWAAFGFAVASIAAEVYSEIVDIDRDVLTSNSLQDAVACCMFDAMQGQVPTYAVFQTSLDNCNFTGDEEELRSLVSHFLTSEDAFMQLFTIMAEVVDLQIAGASFPCDCITWCKEIDLSTVFLCVDQHVATYAAGEVTWTGLGCTAEPGDEKIIAGCFNIDLGAEFHVTRVEIDIVSQGATNCGSPGITAQLLDSVEFPQAGTNLATGGETGTVGWDVDVPDAATLRLALRLPVGETFVVDAVRFYGINFAPSGSGNC